MQIYAWDRLTHKFELISQSTGGNAGDTLSNLPAPSRDGMVVAFQSHATNLVKNDVNGVEDVFVRDRNKGTTIRVSQDSSGIGGINFSYGPSISPDGGWVAFGSSSNNLVWPDRNNDFDVFLYDIKAAKLSLISRGLSGQPANGGSGGPSLGNNASEIWFTSVATDLVPNDTYTSTKVFVYHRLTGLIERVSEFPNGQPIPDSGAVHSNGGHIIFLTLGYPALPNGYTPLLLLRRANSKEPIPVDAFPWSAVGKFGTSSLGALSADGRTAVFRAGDILPQDTNQRGDIYVRHFYPTCTPRNDATIGNATIFDLEDPGAANQIYVAVTGMDFAPGVHVGRRALPAGGPRCPLHGLALRAQRLRPLRGCAGRKGQGHRVVRHPAHPGPLGPEDRHRLLDPRPHSTQRCRRHLEQRPADDQVAAWLGSPRPDNPPRKHKH